MRTCCRVAIAAVSLLLFAPWTARATVGYLMLLSDAQGGCEFADPGSALITTYVGHRLWVLGDNATGVRFRIQPPAGGSWTYLAFQTPFTPVGAADTDLSLAYGQCLTENVTIGYALWFSSEPAPTCSQLEILPAQNFQNVIATDCNFGEFTINALGGIVNPSNACCCDCWATKHSTWGSVKALYR